MSADDSILGVDNDGLIHKKAQVMNDDGKQVEMIKKVDPRHYSGIAGHPSMISIEIFNKSGEIVFFESQLQDDVGFPQYRLAVKDQDFLLLPHMNYKAWTKSGAPVKTVVNMGNCRFKKNTQPSKMIAE